MNNSNFMQDENFISNKENLNGFDDTMDEPMEIDPSTPYINKMRNPIISKRADQEDQVQSHSESETKQESNTEDSKLKEQQPKITKPIGAKIVKPIRPTGNTNGPRVIKPNTTGLPVPNFADLDDIDPFKSKPKIGFETSAFQTPGNFNLRLSDETANDDMIAANNIENPFKPRKSLAQSPPPSNASFKNSIFKALPVPLNMREDDLLVGANQSDQQQEQLNDDEWETHKKRSNGKRSLNTSTNQVAQLNNQSPTLVSSNTDVSCEMLLNCSPPGSTQQQTDSSSSSNQQLVLSTSSVSDGSAVTSSSTSVFSSNTASTSSINNNNNSNNNMKNSDLIDQSNQMANQKEYEGEQQQQQQQQQADLLTDQGIESQQLVKLRSSNFVGNSRGTVESEASGFENCQGDLVDFSQHDDQVKLSEPINSAVESVVFDSIFSNDTDFQSFLDLLEKKEVDNSIKNSPKYSEFARKSLYLQFDPIAQIKSTSYLSPEKVKRLSLIVDKQKAIKCFLGEIAENQIEEEQEEPEASKDTSNLNGLEVNKANQEINSANKNTADMIITNEKLNETSFKMNSRGHETTAFRLSAEFLSRDKFDLNNLESTNESTNKFGRDEQRLNFENSLEKDSLEPSALAAAAASAAAAKTLITLNEDKKLLNSSLNHSFENSKQNTTNANYSILDLDKSTFKNQTNDNSSDCFKLLNDDSVLDDVQFFSKNTKMQNSNNNRTTVNNTKMNSMNNNSNMPSTNGIGSDEDLSSSSLVSSGSAQSISRLLNELNELKEKEKMYLEKIDNLEEENEKFKSVAMDFEEIFQNLVKDKEESEVKLKNEIIELTKERDHLQEDVIGVERAFDDLHRRFEKLKTKVEEFKKNEENLQKAIETYKQQLDKEKFKYSTLKKHAEEKLELANNEIEKLRKSTAVELQTLKAELRKAEIKISSLDLSVQQKDQENTQLTNLLEDLLSKVKPHD